jgi:hypothetical protein
MRQFDPLSAARYTRICVTPVPELLYPEAIALKWIFRQERATLHDFRKGYNNSGTGLSGSSSVVEHRLAKARVASSSLVSRSILHFTGASRPGEEWDGMIRNP